MTIPKGRGPPPGPSGPPHRTWRALGAGSTSRLGWAAILGWAGSPGLRPVPGPPILDGMATKRREQRRAAPPVPALIRRVRDPRAGDVTRAGQGRRVGIVKPPSEAES